MVEKKLPAPTEPFSNSAPYTFSDKDPLQLHAADKDLTAESPHHTLGSGPTQAAPGKHSHKLVEIEGGIEAIDHGLISGLSDNDHPQYSLVNHEHAPGGASDHGELGGLLDDDHPQYPKVDGTRAVGEWPINVSGNANYANSAGSASSAGYATRTGRGSINLNWGNDGQQRTYVLMGNTPEDQSVYPARSLHVRYADEAPSPVRIGTVVTTTNIAGSVYFDIGAFSSAPVICNGDFNAHARAVSLLSWNGPIGRISCGNMNASQIVRINYAVS